MCASLSFGSSILLSGGNGVSGKMTTNRGPSVHVVAQRQVNAQTGEVESFELLSRFEDAEGSCEDNIRRLATNKQLIPFDRYMAAQIITRAPKLIPEPFGIAFNLSGQTLSDPSASADIAQLLLNCKIAQRFTVEVTETEKPSCIKTLRRSLAMIRETGAKVSLDDFGDGFNSFAAIDYCKPHQIKLSASTMRLSHGVLGGLRDMLLSQTDNIVIEGVENRALLNKAQNIFHNDGVWLQGWGIHTPEFLFTAIGGRAASRFIAQDDECIYQRHLTVEMAS